MSDNTGRAQGDAIERATMGIGAVGRALEDGRLFRVVHADGTEWTGDELGAWDDMRVEWLWTGE